VFQKDNYNNISSNHVVNGNPIGTDSTNRSYDNRYIRLRYIPISRHERSLFRFFFKPRLEIDKIVEDEKPIRSGAYRKYLKIIIQNKGRDVAQNCEATLTLIPNDSTALILPSPAEKNLAWDTGENYRTIPAKNGKAILNVVFSQDTFISPQKELTKDVEETKKIYGKISTIHSLNFLDTNSIQFAEDALRIGDTYFKLVVKVITGQITECVLKVSVTSNWHELAMERIS
jgi:hypothetical protein